MARLKAALTATPTVAISSQSPPVCPAPMCWVSRMVVAALMVSSTMTTTFITWLPLPMEATAAAPKWEIMNWSMLPTSSCSSSSAKMGRDKKKTRRVWGEICGITNTRLLCGVENHKNTATEYTVPQPAVQSAKRQKRPARRPFFCRGFPLSPCGSSPRTPDSPGRRRGCPRSPPPSGGAPPWQGCPGSWTRRGRPSCR